MAEPSRGSDFRFLYRQTEGVIDAATWARASLLPVAIALALTLIAWIVAPNRPRDLGSQAFIDPRIIVTNIYFLFFAFVLMLCAVAEYFLSAKRFADLGKPPALAGVAPFTLLLTGAANWYQPRSEGWMPEALAYVFDAFAILVIAWNIWQLGFTPGREALKTGIREIIYLI